MFTKIASVVGVVLLAVACDTVHNEVINHEPELVEVGFELSADATRTSIDPDGKTTRWTPGDKLAVWAKNSEGEYTLERAQFTLRYYSQSYDKAFFSSNIAQMADGEYTYMLSYPMPTSTNGTLATYTIPATQNGEYDGRYDVMLAEPVVEGALNAESAVTLNTIMRHKMHALKIVVPEKASNFDNKIYSLEITFPTAVVGDMVIDVSDPSESPIYKNTSNVVTVSSSEGFNVGDDIWVFVLPGQVTGDVSYTIRGGEQRSEVATYPIDRNMRSGHVTPIRMAMPPFAKYTAFNFSVGDNYLGEDFNFFTLYDSNGTNMGTFNRNAENSYTFAYEGDFDVTPYNNTTWRVVFDTENAVVENSVNLGTLRAYYENDIAPVDIPYLLYEDFNAASESESYGNNSYSSSEREQPGQLLDGAMPTNGWNAARYWLKPGAMRLNSRAQCVKVVLTFASSHHGRMDTPPLGSATRGLKPGKSVKLQMQFDAALYNHIESSLEITESAICVATHTNQNNPIDGIPTGKTGISSEYSTTLADYGVTHLTQFLQNSVGDNAFGQSFPTYTAEFEATSQSRICFYPTIKIVDGTGNAEVNVYIDNIKVQIAK